MSFYALVTVAPTASPALMVLVGATWVWWQALLPVVVGAAAGFAGGQLSKRLDERGATERKKLESACATLEASVAPLLARLRELLDMEEKVFADEVAKKRPMIPDEVTILLKTALEELIRVGHFGERREQLSQHSWALKLALDRADRIWWEAREVLVEIPGSAAARAHGYEEVAAGQALIHESSPELVTAEYSEWATAEAERLRKRAEMTASDATLRLPLLLMEVKDSARAIKQAVEDALATARDARSNA